MASTLQFGYKSGCNGMRNKGAPYQAGVHGVGSPAVLSYWSALIGTYQSDQPLVVIVRECVDTCILCEEEFGLMWLNDLTSSDSYLTVLQAN